MIRLHWSDSPTIGVSDYPISLCFSCFLVALVQLVAAVIMVVYNGNVGSRSSVRFWITLVVGGARHTDPASDPKTRIQQS